MPRFNLRGDQWERIAHMLPGKPGDRGGQPLVRRSSALDGTLRGTLA
jgi:hypothetical protein